MLFLYFAVLPIICSVHAGPAREKRFDAFDPFGYSYPYTGAFAGSHFGGAYAATPFTGAYAAAGFPFGGFVPFPVIRPFPIIPFPDIKPWYKGDNVCETKKLSTEPQDMPDWVKSSFGTSYDFHQTSENCKGDNKKYVCAKRIETTEGSKQEYTLYECCFGFVRPTDGSPGCVESPKKNALSGDSTAEPPSVTPIKMNDDYTRYTIKKAVNLKSGVEKVSPQ